LVNVSQPLTGVALGVRATVGVETVAVDAGVGVKVGVGVNSTIVRVATNEGRDVRVLSPVEMRA
jgi:hypothetical protein